MCPSYIKYCLKRRHFAASYVHYTVDNYLKRTSAIKIVIMKTRNGSQSHAYHTIHTEWYTKEGIGKSMKNALYVQQWSKRHLLG